MDYVCRDGGAYFQLNMEGGGGKKGRGIWGHPPPEKFEIYRPGNQWCFQQSP